MTHPAHILYNTGIALYTLGVRIAALWNSKARKMVRGWNKAWQCKRPEVKVAWFHASSLGEYEQARPVIKRFREAYPDHSVWVTFFSPSGYEVRKATPEADRVTYLPIDTPRNARRLVQLINPSVAFFVKYDFWFNTLRQLRQREVPTFIFSAIFRESQYFFKPYGGWFARQLGCFTHIFVQNDVSLRLLHSRGLQCCTLAGDTRFDRVSEIALSTDGDPTVEQFLAAPADAPRQGDRRRHAGGVLVDVEPAVEVGDSQTFQFQVVVQGERGAEIGLVRLASNGVLTRYTLRIE